MANGSGSFPIGRLGGLLVIVAMTALPFVSCGIVDIQGHEILRNKAPDSGDSSGPGGSVVKEERDTLFEGDNTWIWFIYLGTFALGVFGLLLPTGARVAALVGALGGFGLIFFINRFDNLLSEEIGKGAGDIGGLNLNVGLSWEAGAILAMIGFGMVLLSGLLPTSSGPPD